MKKLFLGLIMMLATLSTFAQKDEDKPIVELNTISITPDGGVEIKAVTTDAFDAFVCNTLAVMYPQPPMCYRTNDGWEEEYPPILIFNPDGSGGAYCQGKDTSYRLACAYCTWQPI